MELADIIMPDGSPDVDALGVYCDWLADQNRDAEAEALRFLYEFQHWPSREERDGGVEWAWWFPVAGVYMNRYEKPLKTPVDDEDLRWWRATLPGLARRRDAYFGTPLLALEFYLRLAAGQPGVLREAASFNREHWDVWMFRLR